METQELTPKQAEILDRLTKSAMNSFNAQRSGTQEEIEKTFAEHQIIMAEFDAAMASGN